MKDFNYLLHSNKTFLICVNENKLFDPECTKAIFYFFKEIYFYTKKRMPLKLARKHKLTKISK